MRGLHPSILALFGLIATATGDTVHGVVVFARHGDRTTKHFGAQMLTPLGAQQLFQVGSEYRARYLESGSPHRIRGVSEFEYVPAQVYASAPDQPILLTTAVSFLQGLYPPLGDSHAGLAAQHLANGSSVSNPLAGYQYATLHGVSSDSPSAVWLKGDDNCPAVAAVSSDFEASPEFASRLTATREFYASLHPLVADFYPSPSDLSYAAAYDIFDVINVARLHKPSSPAARAVTPAQLLQLRTLADSAEFGRNFDASQPARSVHAATFTGTVLHRLRETVSSVMGHDVDDAAGPKFTLLAGSYDTFLAFFGLARLTDVSTDFYGLPDYASTMAFELFSPGDAPAADEAALRVRFLFRNGTEGALAAFPLFGTGQADLAWRNFEEAMQERAIETPAEWCRACHSEAVFCAAYGVGAGVGVAAGEQRDTVSRGSWIATLVVMALAILGNLVWAAMWLVKARRERERTLDKVAKGLKSYDSKESV